MFDLSSKFNSFYSSCVVLPQEVLNRLYSLKNINMQRLKDGLSEYNIDNGTEYKIVEDCVQGSVAMSTVVQNEDNDFDIDVAVVFDKDVLGDKGALATRNIVLNALARKTKQFKADPEVKTSCVRVKYSEGYHIDFAVYRRSWDELNNEWVYEHAGDTWSKRELTGITDWFKSQNDYSDDKLRRVVRLSKMFCNSRDSWNNMPSGLIQTVLCNERLKSEYSRIDELFYYSMKAIVNRLEIDSSVIAPVDNGRNLSNRVIDKKRITYWKNRLKSKLEDLEILFKEECTKDDALQAWYGFFNHEYWREQVSVLAVSRERQNQQLSVKSFDDTEQFIDDLYPVNKIYTCKVSCHISGNGLNAIKLSEYLNKWRWYVPQNLTVRCELVYTDCPNNYKVLWKVKNVGPVSERRNQIRGQIKERGKAIEEPTSFYGNHYIECYIVKNEICVAITRIDIPIGWS